MGITPIDMPGMTFLPVGQHVFSLAYSELCVRYLGRCFDTPHVLVWQWDGFIINPELWTDEFMRWDYVGAPIPRNQFWEQEGTKYPVVGNGGFSLRSRSFVQASSEMVGPIMSWEDRFLCLERRREMEAKGVRYAPEELASRFSRIVLGGEVSDSHFGFHDKSLLAGVKNRLESKWIVPVKGPIP